MSNWQRAIFATSLKRHHIPWPSGHEQLVANCLSFATTLPSTICTCQPFATTLIENISLNIA
jgi:hypothetical protein